MNYLLIDFHTCCPNTRTFWITNQARSNGFFNCVGIIKRPTWCFKLLLWKPLAKKKGGKHWFAFYVFVFFISMKYSKYTVLGGLVFSCIPHHLFIIVLQDQMRAHLSPESFSFPRWFVVDAVGVHVLLNWKRANHQRAILQVAIRCVFRCINYSLRFAVSNSSAIIRHSACWMRINWWFLYQNRNNGYYFSRS